MARRSVTIEIDEKLIAAARAVAARTGVPAEELFDRALRYVLARDFDVLAEIDADQVLRGVAVSDAEGSKLAYEELRTVRAERRNAGTQEREATSQCRSGEEI